MQAKESSNNTRTCHFSCIGIC